MNSNTELNPYECPSCLIAKLDPLFEFKEIILGPCIVPALNEKLNSFINRTVYEKSFKVTQKQLDAKELYIRCIRLDGKDSGHSWPLHCHLYINGKLIEKFTLPKDQASQKRKDFPKLIKSEYCTVGVNQILLIRLNTNKELTEKQMKLLESDSIHPYAFAVVKAKHVTEELFVERVRTEHRLNLEESRKVFMNKLSEQCKINYSDDCICEAALIKVPCTDPYLPGTMMTTPVYGKRCKHLQSFDLERFVRMNGRMNLWKCPYCFEKAFELEVDTYYETLLKAIKEADISNPEITVDCNGHFHINNTYKAIFQDNKLLITKEEIIKCKEEPSNDKEVILIEENSLVPKTNIKEVGSKRFKMSESSDMERIIRIPSTPKIDNPRNPKKTDNAINIEQEKLSQPVIFEFKIGKTISSVIKEEMKHVKRNKYSIEEIPKYSDKNELCSKIESKFNTNVIYKLEKVPTKLYNKTPFGLSFEYAGQINKSYSKSEKKAISSVLEPWGYYLVQRNNKGYDERLPLIRFPKAHLNNNLT